MEGEFLHGDLEPVLVMRETGKMIKEMELVPIYGEVELNM
jgi:hypothetical protein